MLFFYNNFFIIKIYSYWRVTRSPNKYNDEHESDSRCYQFDEKQNKKPSLMRLYFSIWVLRLQDLGSRVWIALDLFGSFKATAK